MCFPHVCGMRKYDAIRKKYAKYAKLVILNADVSKVRRQLQNDEWREPLKDDRKKGNKRKEEPCFQNPDSEIKRGREREREELSTVSSFCARRRSGRSSGIAPRRNRVRSCRCTSDAKTRRCAIRKIEFCRN